MTPALRRRPGAGALLGLLLAAGLMTLAFTTTGGFSPDVAGAGAGAGDTWSEIVIMLIGAAACGATVLLGAPGRAWGGGALVLLAGVTVLTAASIAWSVQPDYSWQDTGRTLAYLAAFAGAAGLARIAPERWPVLVGALAAAAAGLSAWALLAKAFPGTLDAGGTLGRLQQPFGYWNAVGVAAALGVPPCLWLGATRGRARLLRAVAPAAVSLLVSAVVLSFSRSAVLVALLGAGGWLVWVPLRLRAVAVLALGAAGAAVISGWALATHALTGDRVALPARTSAGHTFGIVLLVTLATVTAAGFAGWSAFDRRRLSPGLRLRIGTALVVGLALVPLAGVVALAESSRGFTGEVSHAWSTLTNPRGGVGDTASRIGSLGNARPVYWSEGIAVGKHAPLAGAGAEGYATAHYAYATSTLPVSHAHSYVIQTFSDFGLIGLALNLALLVAWIVAALRPLALRTASSSLAPERVNERQGMITLAVVVLAYGVQSAIDWTWFFAGVTIPALLCAGWLAGRGPLVRPVGRAAGRRSLVQRPAAAALLITLVTIALLGAWTTWQPLRSADALSTSLNDAAQSHTGSAFTAARAAAAIDPVSIAPLQILSSLYSAVNDLPAARAALVQATERQPRNPQPWLWLGQFDSQRHQPRLAYRSAQRALRLDPIDPTTLGLIMQTRAKLGLPSPGG